MGTFHSHKGDLHGITVVVDTTGDTLYIGRCDQMTEEVIILEDVDVRREGEGGKTKEEHARAAARLGVWKRIDRVVLELDEVTSVRRLGELGRG